MYYVYTILNQLNYKYYVGQTKNPLNRWSAHKCEAKSNRAYLPIHRALKKYGIENFQFCIVDVSTSQLEANWDEEFWIQILDSRGEGGYNLAVGGSSNSGWHHTEDSKKRIADAQRGIKRRPHTKEERIKVSISLVGHQVSEETKQKISEAQKGKPRWTEEEKRQMSISRKGVAFSQERNDKISSALKGKYTGENNSQSKLTWILVSEIRATYTAGGISMSKLAERYKISSALVSKIVNNQIWIKQ